MTTFRFELPDISKAHALADWVEVMMLLTQKSQISRAQLLDALGQTLGMNMQEIETPVNFLYAEIDRRRYIAGKGYPLFIEETLIKLDSKSNVEFYKFLLLVSLDGPLRLNKRYADVDRIFDDVVAEAVKAYMGSGSHSIRFAWPPSGDRPKNFKDALEWLSTLIGIPLGNGIPPLASKDGGVDVVAWKPFKDLMSAFAVMYVQSTVQKNWHTKGTAVIPAVWLSRIDTGAVALTALAIPFVLSRNDDKWDDLRRTVSVLFDRLRLTQMLCESDERRIPAMAKWSKKEIGKYRLDTWN